MPQHRIRAVYARGGTSRGVILRREDLPSDPGRWDPIFLRILGSPDPYRRQLDGMGGGISSLSKIVVVGPPTVPHADVDYTVAQVAVDEPVVDYASNCGNMSAAIGPFAIEEGLFPSPADGHAVVRLHNTNTSKIIVSRFAVEGSELATYGDMSIDGVAGTHAGVRLEFLDPGGSKTGQLLPTGHAVDPISIPGKGEVAASIVDIGNPAVFVAAADFGVTGAEAPETLDRDATFSAGMESLRRAASVAAGLAPDLEAAGRLQSIPKVAVVSAPQPMTTLSGRVLRPEDMDIAIRMISMGLAHRAVPVTGALCLAVATRIAGSIPNRVAPTREGPIRVAHASGVTIVDAKVTATGAAEYCAVYRTTRRLFEGTVLYRAEEAA